MARTELTVPSAYTPDGVKANYDANIAASNDNFEELYGVETQAVTTTPVNVTMPIVVLSYSTGGAKIVNLPAVANTTLRRINITKTVGVTSTATVKPQTGEYLDGVQDGTLLMTDLGLSVTFTVIDGKWVSDWPGKSAGAPDGMSMAFKPGGTDQHIVFQTDVAAGGKIKIVDTTTGITDEYPSTWIQANRIELGQGSSYVGAVLSGRSDGALVLKSAANATNLAAYTAEHLILATDAGKNLIIRTDTSASQALLSADTSGRLVSASGYYGTSLTGTAVTGVGSISATLIADASANTGTATTVFDSTAKLWFAQKFTAGSTATAQAVSVKLAKLNATAPLAATSTITAYIHADSTGAVGSVLLGGTGTAIRFDSITSTDQTEFYFGGMSAALSSGTAYWIVVKASAAVTAGGITHDSAAATAGTYGQYNSGTTTWDYTPALAAWAKVHTTGGVGLTGTSTINNGVTGTSTVGYGGSFTSTRSRGVYGYGQTHGVYGETNSSTLVGLNYGLYGMAANSSGYGVCGSGNFGGGIFFGVIRGIDVTQTTGRSVITQSAASTTNEVLYVTRTGAGYGPLIKASDSGTVANSTTGNGTSLDYALLVTGGTGGATSYNSGTGGTGAGISLTGGVGGASTNVTAGTGGVGGSLLLTAGDGGNATATTGGTGGNGGNVKLTAGNAGTVGSGGTPGKHGWIVFDLASIPIYANEAAALAAGCPTGGVYRLNADPATLCIFLGGA